MRSLNVAIIVMALASSSFAQFQTNQAASTLTLNGASSNGTTATEITVGTATNVSLGFSTNANGFPYDIAFNGAAQANPGLTIGTQLVNLNLAAGLNFLSGSGAGFVVPGQAIGGSAYSLSITFSCPAPATISLQAYAISPAVAGNVALSSAVTLSCFQDNQVLPSSLTPNPSGTPLTLTDDSFSAQALVAPFTFYGTVFSTAFVGSNGFVTFSTGNVTFLESVGALTAGQPRIAMWWDDFNPSAAGQVRFFQDAAGFEVAFVNVPEFTTTNQNSFVMQASAAGVIFDYSSMASVDGLVGLTSGGNLTPAVAINWSLGAGIVLNPATSPFELFVAGTNPSDLNGKQVTIFFDATGSPILAL